MSEHLSLVSSRQMAAIDQATIEAGTPGRVLMERAGVGVWAVARDRFDLQALSSTVFLCGKGNNGGDGFVAARHARNAGLDPFVILFGDEQQVTGDALYHLQSLREAGVDIHSADTADLEQVVAGATVVFDGLLGTGLSGAPRPRFADAIRAMSRTTARIVAIDVPSGMDPDTGAGQSAQADLTVTFGGLKRAHVFAPGKQQCGNVAVIDIGLSVAAAAANRTGFVSHTVSDPRLPERSPTDHKGDAGRVVVIAGSKGLTGAACLTAGSALRSGAGLVTLALPETLNDIVEVKLTEVMTRPVPEVRRHRCLALRARGQILDACAGADVVAMGPGLGRHRETFELVRRIIHDVGAPVVLDADGLNAFEGRAESLKTVRHPLILTPHPGEYRRLTGRPVSDALQDARHLSDETGAIVVLKGAPSVVALPAGDIFVNPTGNPGMATGGSGDVLTGMIAALIAQGSEPGEAAVAATYWHGLAGDLSARRLGERGMIAGDLVNAIPEAERTIARGEGSSRNIDYRRSTDLDAA